MMKNYIKKYDVTLKRLTEEKIETVRIWRNDPKISQYMEYREEITSDMQKKWFKTIDNDNNLYYIIEYKDEEIGLINIKDLDTGKRSGESGVFIYADQFLNTDIAYRAHLCLFDYYFLEMGYEELHAHILDFNKRASRLCEFIGYKQIGDSSYSLVKDDYISNRNRERFIKKYNYLKNKNHE